MKETMSSEGKTLREKFLAKKGVSEQRSFNVTGLKMDDF